MGRLFFLIRFFFLFLLVGVAAMAQSDEVKKIETCGKVFDEIMAIPEQAIPPELFKNAQGIAIIPSVIKVGFVIGGRHGSGILMVKNQKGSWSDPAFITLTGGSLGWQIGAQSTDVILVFKTRRSINGIVNGKFTLGADASVAAGPVGRSAAAATDVQLGAEIYSYARSRGLFAGIALDGTAIQIDDLKNARFYQKSISPSQILFGSGLTNEVAVAKLKDKLLRYTR